MWGNGILSFGDYSRITVFMYTILYLIYLRMFYSYIILCLLMEILDTFIKYVHVSVSNVNVLIDNIYIYVFIGSL